MFGSGSSDRSAERTELRGPLDLKRLNSRPHRAQLADGDVHHGVISTLCLLLGQPSTPPVKGTIALDLQGDDGVLGSLLGKLTGDRFMSRRFLMRVPGARRSLQPAKRHSSVPARCLRPQGEEVTREDEGIGSSGEGSGGAEATLPVRGLVFLADGDDNYSVSLFVQLVQHTVIAACPNP